MPKLMRNCPKNSRGSVEAALTILPFSTVSRFVLAACLKVRMPVALDWDKDGKITVDEAVAPVTNIAADAQSRPRIQVAEGLPLPTKSAGMSPVVALAAAALFLLGIRKWSKHSRLRGEA